MVDEELTDMDTESDLEAPTGEDIAADEIEGDSSTDESVFDPTDLLAQLASLEEKLVLAETSLAEAEKLAAEYLDGWQRAQASFVNFRKRTENEQAQVQARANARLLSRIVPVMDDFKRAFEAIPEADAENPWLNGICLVQRKLQTVLESENVMPIEVKPGDMFDPNFHEAVLYQEVEGFDEGQIVTEIETGYTLADRILRPTTVVVAKERKSVTQPMEVENDNAAALDDVKS